MSSTVCNPLCAEDLPIQIDANCETIVRNSGIKHLILHTCDLLIDVTSQTAVAAAKAAGDIIISPRGLGSIPAATIVEQADLDACGRSAIKYFTRTAAFKTYDTRDDFAEINFWNKIIGGKFRVAFVGCDDIIYHNNAYSPTGDNPFGFEYKITGSAGLNIAEKQTDEVQSQTISFEWRMPKNAVNPLLMDGTDLVSWLLA